MVVIFGGGGNGVEPGKYSLKSSDFSHEWKLAEDWASAAVVRLTGERKVHANSWKVFRSSLQKSSCSVD